MKFSIRDLFLVTVIVALASALIFTRRQGVPSRYLIVDECRYLVDTQTGQVWFNDKDFGRWREYRPPRAASVFCFLSLELSQATGYRR